MNVYIVYSIRTDQWSDAPHVSWHYIGIDKEEAQKILKEDTLWREIKTKFLN